MALLAPQDATGIVQQLRGEDPEVVVWLWTPVGCVSAVRRLWREGRIEEPELWRCLGRLDELRDVWTEVIDVRSVRARAERCLHVHALRAADAGQLAAALLFSERAGRSLPFVTLDVRLAAAARREGLEVPGVSPASGH